MGLKANNLISLNWKRLIGSTMIIYCILTIYVYVISDRLMFPYNQSSYDIQLKGLNILTTKDNTKLAVRFWKSSNEKNLILYLHGNYLDLGDLDFIAEKFNEQGYSFLTMDYRGYGLSEGKVSEKNAYQDSQLLFDYAIKLGYLHKKIIIVGRSIGTGLATELALNNRSKALILISPFVSAYRVVTKIPLFLFDKFDNLSKISKITEPLFIVHGNLDAVIHPWHSLDLYNNYNGIKYRHLIQGVGHNDLFDENFDEILNQFELFSQRLSE